MNDDDFLPSVPHAHSLDGNYKLELWSGDITNAKGKVTMHATKKDMMKLYNDPRIREYVDACRESYKERHPGRMLKELSKPRGYQKSGVAISLSNKRIYAEQMPTAICFKTWCQK